jgi:hypothetical protein
MLWSADIKLHTLHTRDWCQAAWSAAMWCASRSREEANTEAGVSLPRILPKDKAKYGDTIPEADLERCCPRKKIPKAPVFNVVDDSNTTQ